MSAPAPIPNPTVVAEFRSAVIGAFPRLILDKKMEWIEEGNDGRTGYYSMTQEGNPFTLDILPMGPSFGNKMRQDTYMVYIRHGLNKPVRVFSHESKSIVEALAATRAFIDEFTQTFGV